MTTVNPIDVSPLLKWIPEKIKSEIVAICTSLLVIAQLVTSFVVLNGATAHNVSLAVAVLTVVLGAVARGTVTPTHLVAVDKRDTTSPINVGTSGPIEPGEVPPELA